MNNFYKRSFLSESWWSISKIILAVVSLYVLYMVKDIIIWIIFALIIAILFNYLIDPLEKKKIPRLLSASVLYLAVFALLAFFIYNTAPLLWDEMAEFVNKLDVYLGRVFPFFERIGFEAFSSKEAFLETVQSRLQSASASVFSALFAVFGSASTTLFVLALSFFISIEKKFIEKALGLFSPLRYREYSFKLWQRTRQKVNGWFITRIIGMVFIGAATYLVLRIMGLPYAFVLSLVAGLLDLVPILGPVVAGFIIGIVIALTSLPKGLLAVLIFALIQQVENNFLMPVLFRRFTGMSPVLVLVALAVGGKLWGVAGAILSIPLAGVLFEILKDYLIKVHRKPPADEPPVDRPSVELDQPPVSLG